MLYQKVSILTSSMQGRVFSEINISNPNISQGSILQHRMTQSRCFPYSFMFIVIGGEGKTCGALMMCET